MATAARRKLTMRARAPTPRARTGRSPSRTHGAVKRRTARWRRDTSCSLLNQCSYRVSGELCPSVRFQNPLKKLPHTPLVSGRERDQWNRHSALVTWPEKRYQRSGGERARLCLLPAEPGVAWHEDGHTSKRRSHAHGGCTDPYLSHQGAPDCYGHHAEANDSYYFHDRRSTSQEAEDAEHCERRRAR